MRFSDVNRIYVGPSAIYAQADARCLCEGQCQNTLKQWLRDDPRITVATPPDNFTDYQELYRATLLAAGTTRNALLFCLERWD